MAQLDASPRPTHDDEALALPAAQPASGHQWQKASVDVHASHESAAAHSSKTTAFAVVAPAMTAFVERVPLNVDVAEKSVGSGELRVALCGVRAKSSAEQPVVTSLLPIHRYERKGAPCAWWEEEV